MTSDIETNNYLLGLLITAQTDVKISSAAGATISPKATSAAQRLVTLEYGADVTFSGLNFGECVADGH